MYSPVLWICNNSLLRCPHCLHFIVSMTSLKLVSLHLAFQLLSNGMEPRSQHEAALSLIFSFQSWDVNQQHNKRKSNGNLPSHWYFFILTASQVATEKLKHNSFYDIRLCFVLFIDCVKCGIRAVFVSFLFIRSFCLHPTCL
jgi:hypothetical protein